MELLFNVAILAVVGAIIWGLWNASRGRRVFVVKVNRGEAVAVSGKVTPAFLREVREIAALNGVAKGRVAGLVAGPRIRLEFSSHFPAGSRQQLRNWWGMHGWRAGKGRA